MSQTSPPTQIQKRPQLNRNQSQKSFYKSGSLHARVLQETNPGAAINQVYAGLGVKRLDNGTYRYCLVFNDGVQMLHHDIKDIKVGDSSADDSDKSNGSTRDGSRSSSPFDAGDVPMVLQQQVIEMISEYRTRKLCKPMGVGLTEETAKLSPKLMVEIWNKLDAVPFIFSPKSDISRDHTTLTADEEAESLARETVKQFVMNDVSVTHGPKHEVEVDSAGRAHITDLETYHNYVNMDTTWPATLKFAQGLKKKNTKIAFFNTTPQGGGVALMRHALVRYLRLLGVDCAWYNPVIRPEAVRATKDNHNILQGVAEHGERLTDKKIELLDTWIRDNVERCNWVAGGGPLAPRERGGADVIIVDDPQMPILVQIAKERDPHRPVIFRSHIQIRGDLVDQGDTPAAEVWNWIWERIKECDVFVSHPVKSFVPSNVPAEKVGYLPASTDWFDGLNKQMDAWDEQYFIHECKSLCFSKGMRPLAFPSRNYIVQIARFDPAKGIPDVLAAYVELRTTFFSTSTTSSHSISQIPQLVIAGHTAADDPDVVRIFDDTQHRIASLPPDIANDIIVLRIPPSDQLLNALLSCASIALQLSTREGFEVKVSEALHKGKPIIASRAGGIPLQVAHGKSGFLVPPGDYKAVAKYLYELCTDEALYARMAKHARENVSDEVGTVGNALSWLYLADALAGGETVRPQGRWINDLARERAGYPYREGEPRLPRRI